MNYSNSVDEITLTLRLLSVGLAFITIIICQLFPKRWIWIGATVGIFAGMFFVFDNNRNFLQNFFIGGITGIVFSTIMVISGLISKYYGEIGDKEIERKKSNRYFD
jgi:hypothetical protein